MSLFSDISSFVPSSAQALSTFKSFGQAVAKPGSLTITKPKLDNSYASERLYVLTSRAGALSYSDPSSYQSNRGDIARIRLLSPNKLDVTSRGTEVQGLDLTQDLTSLGSGTFAKFMLTDVAVSYSEKVQVNTVFGDSDVVYYFGKNPPSVQISGLIFDDVQSNWFSTFLGLYDSTFRGTKLASRFEMIELLLPNMKMVGSIASLSYSQNSTTDVSIPFSITFIPKTILPLPALKGKGTLTKYATLLNFSAGKSAKDYLAQYGSPLSGVLKSFGFTDTVNSFSGALDSFRSNVVSPIYGMITIITKVVKATSGDITSLISSFTDPVNRILGDITGIATQTVALAKVIEQSAKNISAIPRQVEINLRNTLHSLKNSAGVISRVPESVSEIVKRSYSTGNVKSGSSLLLLSGPRGRSKSNLLNSGKPYSAQKAYSL